MKKITDTEVIGVEQIHQRTSGDWALECRLRSGGDNRQLIVVDAAHPELAMFLSDLINREAIGAYIEGVQQLVEYYKGRERKTIEILTGYRDEMEKLHQDVEDAKSEIAALRYRLKNG